MTLSLMPPTPLPTQMAAYFRTSFGTDALSMARHMASQLTPIDPTSAQLYTDTAKLLEVDQ